jgi:Uma2 family endonuclease
MMGSPRPVHQELVRKLDKQIDSFLEGKECKLYQAPLDVRLNPDVEALDDVVVQPDLFVVCDKTKVGETAILGPPDLVVEVVSQGTKSFDLGKKKDAYEKFGVKEYWVVLSETELVRYDLVDGAYVEGGKGNGLDSKLFEGMKLNLG